MDLKSLADQLKAAGQLSDFIGLLCDTAKPSMCHVEGPFGNLYCRPMEFESLGSVQNGHTHNYDHVTYIVRGSVLVKFYKVDEQGNQITTAKDQVYKAGGKVQVRADTWHQFTALEENTYAECVFPHRDSAGNIVDEFNGIMASYG